MDRYKTQPNASIFNFKQNQNKFQDDLFSQEFVNKIKNPNFLETRAGSVFAWHSLGTVDVDTPTSIDLDNKTITYEFSDLDQMTQDLALELDTEYTLVFDAERDNTAEVTISVESTTADFIVDSNVENNVEMVIEDQKNVLRFKTKSSGTLGNAQFKIQNTSNVTVEITFKNIIMTIGNLALLGATYAELSEKVRWNNVHDFWEITVDEGITWEQIWTDSPDFDAKMNLLIEQKTIAFIHQDNILEGAGITIEASNIDDGMGGLWPALTISADGGAGGGAGGGDWTREDMVFQALLESSDFSNVSYNTLQEQGTVILHDGASYTTAIDGTGVGSITGTAGDSFETDNVIPAGTPSSNSLYIHPVIEGTAVFTADYNYGIAGVYQGWIACPIKETVFAPEEFDELKIRLTFESAGLTRVTSYGVLFGHESISGNPPNGFLEVFNSNIATGQPVTIPGTNWYHRDGKSLEVFYDGIRMLEGIDYNEVDVGFVEKSNQVTFTFALMDTKYVVFKEVYSEVINGSGTGGGAPSGGIVADSELLDGLDSTQFLRSDVPDTAVGPISFTRISADVIGNTNATQLGIGAGETANYLNSTNMGPSETLWLGGDSSVRVVASPDNWVSGWASRKENVLINSSGNAIFGGDASFAGTITVPQITANTVTASAFIENGTLISAKYLRSDIDGTLNGDLTVTGDCSFGGAGSFSGTLNVPVISSTTISANTISATSFVEGSVALSSKYLRADVDAVINGKLTIIRNIGTSSTYSNSQLELRSTNETDVAIGFHRSGFTACELRHESNGLILSGTGEATAADLQVMGNIIATGNVTAFSDERIKTNLEIIPNAIEKIGKINGYTFDRMDFNNERHTGVLAQELEKVLPEAVVQGKTPEDLKSVAYGNIVGLLIEGIKEQQETIEELESRIQSLEASVQK